jgi:hypothetical protein
MKKAQKQKVSASVLDSTSRFFTTTLSSLMDRCNQTGQYRFFQLIHLRTNRLSSSANHGHRLAVAYSFRALLFLLLFAFSGQRRVVYK